MWRDMCFTLDDCLEKRLGRKNEATTRWEADKRAQKREIQVGAKIMPGGRSRESGARCCVHPVRFFPRIVAPHRHKGWVEESPPRHPLHIFPRHFTPHSIRNLTIYNDKASFVLESNYVKLKKVKDWTPAADRHCCPVPHSVSSLLGCCCSFRLSGWRSWRGLTQSSLVGGWRISLVQSPFFVHFSLVHRQLHQLQYEFQPLAVCK